MNRRPDRRAPRHPRSTPPPIRPIHRTYAAPVRNPDFAFDRLTADTASNARQSRLASADVTHSDLPLFVVAPTKVGAHIPEAVTVRDQAFAVAPISIAPPCEFFCSRKSGCGVRDSPQDTSYRPALFVTHQHLDVIPAKAGIQGERQCGCPGFPLSRE